VSPMTDRDFGDIVTMVEGFTKILVVLVPKVKNGTATEKEKEAYAEALSGLDDYREKMAYGIAEKWSRYAVLKRIAGSIAGAGPALVPVLKDLRDLARFKIINEPSSRPLWEGRLRQIEWDIRQLSN